MTSPQATGLTLAFDTSSPVTSVAVGRNGAALTSRSAGGRHSSERLLALIAFVLEEIGLELKEIETIVALQGPGSFTGLRVGLSTALGLREAGHPRAGTLSTWRALAAAAPTGSERIVAVVDAHRGQWGARPFSTGSTDPESEAMLIDPPELHRFVPCTVVGFGLEALRSEPVLATSGFTFHEPEELATAALRALSRHAPDLDSASLSAPIYLRPPAVDLV